MRWHSMQRGNKSAFRPVHVDIAWISDLFGRSHQQAEDRLTDHLFNVFDEADKHLWQLRHVPLLITWRQGSILY